MKQLIRFSLLLLASLMVAGCESPGRSLSKSAIQQIRDSQTTRTEVDKIFGEPKQMTRSSQGRTLYFYERYYGPSGSFSSSAPFQESHLLTLSVLFNPNDVVEKHLYSHTRPDVSSRMLTAGRELNPEELRRITPQKTTEAELGAWFGPHWSEQLTLTGSRLVIWLYASAIPLGGRVDVQALEVLMNDNGTVGAFRVTKQDPAH